MARGFYKPAATATSVILGGLCMRGADRLGSLMTASSEAFAKAPAKLIQDLHLVSVQGIIVGGGILMIGYFMSRRRH